MAKCNICKDRKEIEVIVMGTDTDWVECPYCKPSEEEIERNKKIKQLKKKMKLKHLNKEYVTAKDFSLAIGFSEKFWTWYLDNISTVFWITKRYYRYNVNGETIINSIKPNDKEYEVVYK